MQPPESPETWLSQFAALIGIGVAAFAAWIWRYLLGRREGDDGPALKHVILEQAELADIGGLVRTVRDLAPKLDAHHDLLKELIMIARRLDTGMQLIREAQIVSAARDESERRERR